MAATTAARGEHRSTAPPLPPRSRPPYRNLQLPKPAESERLPRAKLYARRYLALDVYQRELARGPHRQLSNLEKMRLFGSTIVPIHVPLAPRETKHQYEARFRGWLTVQGLALEELEKDADENLERYYWFKFANENARGALKYAPAATRKRDEENGTSDAETRDFSTRETKRPRSENDAPNGQLQCRDDDRGEVIGKKARLEEMTHPAEKSAAPSCGRGSSSRSTSRSDTMDTKKQRRDEEDATQQRADNAVVRRDAGSSRDPQLAYAKDLAFTCSLMLPARHASLKEVSMAYSSCGCRQCLTRGMQHLAMAVTKAEARQCESCGDSSKIIPSKHVVDLTDVSERNVSNKQRHSGPPDIDTDIVETQLMVAYDEINEQIVMNESALQTEVARLGATPRADTQEMARLHDENQELQEMLQSEMDARNATLAMLIVCMWRYEQSELEAMARDRAAQHVTPVQRTCHAQCAQLAAVIREKHEYMAKLRRQLASLQANGADGSTRLATMKQRLREMLLKAESEVRQLRDQRRQQLKVLVHFDASLRQLIQSLLAKIDPRG